MQLDHYEHGLARLKIPFREEFVGDQERRLLHSSLMITTADTAAGLAVFCTLPSITPIATLDLHLDYLQPAVAEQTLWAEAKCLRLTDNIAFTRVKLWQASADDPIAYANASFMRDTMKNNGNSTGDSNTDKTQQDS